MLLKIVQFISLFLMALATGVVFSHLLEKNTKATLSAPVFLKIQQVLISNFGVVMGLIEGGAFLATLIVVFLVALFFTLVGLVCIAAMILVWAAFINPINQTVNTWTEQSLPPNWMHSRDRWASLHALRTVLAVIGLSALILAVLVG
jgi:hypothetical protein